MLPLIEPIIALKRLYDEYKSINEKVININRGGCGVFAEHLYITLTKLGLDPKIVVITNSVKEFEKRMEGLDYDWSDGQLKHIMVYVNGYYQDCEGIFDSIGDAKWSGVLYTGLTIEKLKEWNGYENNFWNETFDRDKIPTIEKTLTKSYKKVVKSLDIPINSLSL